MEYHDSSSTARLDSLVYKVFNPAGYSCSYGSYNEQNVKNMLLENMPVPVLAFRARGLAGHSFLIDGYQRTRIHTETLHYYRTPDGLCVPGYDSYITHSYSSPEITAIKMNWGWWNQWSMIPVNDGWYTLTGGWTALLAGSNVTYEYNRKMITGFSILNN